MENTIGLRSRRNGSIAPGKPGIPVNLNQNIRMTIELPSEIEAHLRETAKAQGVSVGEYIEKLVAETNLRRSQVAGFRAAIAERMASLDAGENEDGEAVMAGLIAELPPQ